MWELFCLHLRVPFWLHVCNRNKTTSLFSICDIYTHIYSVVWHVLLERQGTMCVFHVLLSPNIFCLPVMSAQMEPHALLLHCLLNCVALCLPMSHNMPFVVWQEIRSCICMHLIWIFTYQDKRVRCLERLTGGQSMYYRDNVAIVCIYTSFVLFFGGTCIYHVWNICKCSLQRYSIYAWCDSL